MNNNYLLAYTTPLFTKVAIVKPKLKLLINNL